MKQFFRIFSSWLLTVFSLFILNLNFVVAGGGESTIIVTSSFADTCSWNFQCEQIGDSVFTCHSTSDFISSGMSAVHHVPIGKSELNVSVYGKISLNDKVVYHGKKETLYKGPDTYSYPFVGIIKIQV